MKTLKLAFTEGSAGRIREGAKTQTRRLVNEANSDVYCHNDLVPRSWHLFRELPWPDAVGVGSVIHFTSNGTLCVASHRGPGDMLADKQGRFTPRRILMVQPERL